MRRITYIFLFIFVFQSNAQIADFKTVKFDKADKIALKYKDENLSNLPQLSYKLTSELTTDIERFRAIFKWVCSNISNDYSMFTRNMRKRRRYRNDSVKLAAWNAEFKKTAFKKLLKKNRTVCTGYAYLVKELASLAGIECKIVNGHARTSTINIETLDINSPNHSWNAVKLNDKWYLCDPTWASGIPNPTTYRFQFYFNDGFFLSDPNIFSINHYPQNEEWFLLAEEKPTFNMFLEAPVIYGNAYNYFSNHLEPKKLDNTVKQNEKVTFRYRLLKNINKNDVHLIVEKNENEKKVKPSFISTEKTTLIFEHAFDFRGYYDVHLYIKNDLIATYSFEVKK
ncbi:transglutaminase domain-containing protein [uncultured Kordia sp.]|uniref:transglutaminase domain-containing protein n=1 Tax=uncultured Kordia sp. TaxID=507699 RepID=UPI00262860DA|nr:transglutaminase domain-containing protein [uncultured Kordia sp.]